MTLKEKRAAALKAAEAIINGAKTAGRSATDEEMTQFDGLVTEVKGFDTELERVARSEKSFADIKGLFREEAPAASATGEVEAKSLSEHFIKSVGVESLARTRGVKGAGVSTKTEFKAAIDTQVTGGGAVGPLDAFLVETDRTLVRGAQDLTPVSSMLGQGTITIGSAIQYFIEGAIEGDVDAVLENGTKAQLHIADPTPQIAYLRTLAGYTKVTDEYFEDLALLAGEIDGRLVRRLARAIEREVLTGNGTGAHLTGLLNVSGVQTLTATATGVPLAEAILDATTLIETNTDGLSADAVLLNRADFVSMRKAKDSNGQYYGGGFFSGAYGNGAVIDGSSLWDGLRIVVSPFVPVGTALVGAFQDAATLYTKGGVRVEMTNSNQDDFINDRVTLRAQRRAALATRVPAGLVKITVTPAI
ncbi:phage major capsid protein [Cryobacterium sp. Hh7]|uniref:phage major capsid protein n=1 Tax=Cryobacterium sp. Hh7 TaxID=1259159 RepID=UPI001069AD2A|nr:phage major capsid protein [Cryobacterium sp. Hh7]TFD58039.1 phage major capsid protein [Cryobacterium sp. Hh7]